MKISRELRHLHRLCRYQRLPLSCLWRSNLDFDLPKAISRSRWICVPRLVSTGPAVWPTLQNIHPDTHADTHKSIRSRIHAMASIAPCRQITLSEAPRSGTMWQITCSITALVKILLYTARQRQAMCRTAEIGCSRNRSRLWVKDNNYIHRQTSTTVS